MKKKILIILLVIIISLLGLSKLQWFLSNRVIDLNDAISFINVEDVDLNRVTLLHNISNEVQIYSEANEEVFFTIINPSDSMVLYINREFILQNQSKDYPMYNGSECILFSIDSQNYKNYRANLYAESQTLDTNGFNNSWFIGSQKSIMNLLVGKKSVDIIIVAFFIMSVITMAFINRGDKYLTLLILSTLVILIDFKIGLSVGILMIYFSSDKFIKLESRTYIVGGIFIISCIIPIEFYRIYCLIFTLLSIIDFYNKNNIKGVMSLITLTTILGLSFIDLRMSFFRAFYEDLYIAVITIFLLCSCLLKLRMYFAREKMIRVDLLREISHDLRLPLSTIKLNTELLERDDFNIALKKKTIIGVIKAAIDDLVYMTSSLNAYISKDDYIDKSIRSSVQDSIYHTIDYFRNNKKNIEFETLLCVEEVYLPINRVWLNRLIYNLVDNAYKYTDNYGKITIGLKQEKNKKVITIRDNGKGMTPEQQTKVIEPFYRVDKSRNISGLGLGLSIVKTIVENLNGDLVIDSKLGEYSEFKIII